MNKRAVTWAGLLIAILMAVAYVVSPFLALRELRVAARERDRDSLERLVDFPAVRGNLKSQLSAKLLQSVHQDPDTKGDLLAALGARLAPVLLNRIIDRVVTPDGLMVILREARVHGGGGGSAPTAPKVEGTWTYTGIDSFQVQLRRKDDPDARVTLILRRTGLFGWRVTSVDVADLLSDETRHRLLDRQPD